MALHEPIRSSIFLRFEELLGTEEAAAVMGQFPTYDLADVVTAEMLDLRLRETEQRVRTEIAEVRTEIAGVRGTFGERLGSLETRVADLPDIITKQILFWLVPLFLTSIGMALAVARLGH